MMIKKYSIKKFFIKLIFCVFFFSTFFLSIEYTRAIGASPSSINWGRITTSTAISAPLRITQGSNRLFSSFKTSVVGRGAEALRIDTATGSFSTSSEYYPINIALDPKKLIPGPYSLHVLITPEGPINKAEETVIIPGITIKINFEVVTSSYINLIPHKTTVNISSSTLFLKSGFTNDGTDPVTISRISLQKTNTADEMSIFDFHQLKPKKTYSLEITTTTYAESFFVDNTITDIFFYNEKNALLAHTTSVIKKSDGVFRPLIVTNKKMRAGSVAVIMFFVIVMCGILAVYIFRKK